MEYKKIILKVDSTVVFSILEKDETVQDSNFALVSQINGEWRSNMCTEKEIHAQIGWPTKESKVD